MITFITSHTDTRQGSKFIRQRFRDRNQLLFNGQCFCLFFCLDNIQLLDMDGKREADPKWEQFIQSLDQDGKVIGFTLPNNDYIFRYDSTGGWQDQNGNYYNADGVLQSDEDDVDSIEDEEEEFENHDDELVDQFEQMLMDEEQGIVRKPPKKEQSQVPAPVVEKKVKEEGEYDFKGQLQKYVKKEQLREELPAELFIYFKMKTKYYEEVEAITEKLNSVADKNKAVAAIREKIQSKRQELIKGDPWLASPGVFLDFSGDSEEAAFYDRYWYGSIKTTAESYQNLIESVKNSQKFNLLQIKTFYALKSKFYLKKSQQNVKKQMAQIKQKIQAFAQDQVALIKIDNLPENFPLSFIFDLIEFVGGRAEDIQQVKIVDEFSVELTSIKETALKLVNLQAYNHQKGQYIELSLIGEPKPRVSKQGKHFYFIGVDSQFKIHERQLHDTLALECSATDLAKQFTKEQDGAKKLRFAVGSVTALRRVLMFRGDSLIAVRISPKQ